MIVTLTISRYKTWAIPFAFLSMVIFRCVLFFNKKIEFYKLLGSGKNGTFDKNPDWRQWAILTVHTPLPKNESDQWTLLRLYGNIISRWLHCFAAENYTIVLSPLMGHGLWDGQEVFGKLNPSIEYKGPIATLTRATIKLSKLKFFWKHVAPVAQKMRSAPGFVFSLGIGEVPWIKQATFSVWDSVESMKAFAYGMKEHSEVIKKTRQQKWYSEDMFVRFTILKTFGKIHQEDPLKRIL